MDGIPLGGFQLGTIFKLTAGGNLTTLYSFTSGGARRQPQEFAIHFARSAWLSDARSVFCELAGGLLKIPR